MWYRLKSWNCVTFIVHLYMCIQNKFWMYTTHFSVSSWNVELHFSHLLFISNPVIISVCTHVFSQLSHYYGPTLVSFSFADLSERQEPKQGERSEGGKKQRKGEKQRQGAPFNCEPDGGTRQSHPTEEERDRWGRGLSLHKHTHMPGEKGWLQTEKERGR